MSYVPNYDQALEVLKQYNEESFHIHHGQIVGGVMRYFASEYDPERADFWEIVGLLHDLDYGKYPEEHCIKQVAIMEGLDYSEELIRATASHGYGMTKTTIQPELMMEKVLYAVDELTGIIGAAALMRPSKSVADMTLKSVKKKFKDKRFAAGCSRDVIKQGADQLGWEVVELQERTLEAMKTLVERFGV